MREAISSICAAFPAGGSVESVPLRCGDLTVHLTEEGPAYAYDYISDRSDPKLQVHPKAVSGFNGMKTAAL